MFNSKLLLSTVLFITLCILESCAPSEEMARNRTTNQQGVSGVTRTTQQSTTQQSSNNSAEEDRITLNYTNQSSGIEIQLDPEKDEFFLELTGMKPAEKDTVIIADSALIAQREKDIQQVLSKFRQAQDLFYLDEYTEALRLLNETLEIAETADAYALKGTIHFMMGNSNATRRNWNRAVQLNPDLPIPNIPELESIIEEIIAEEQESEQEETEVQEEEQE